MTGEQATEKMPTYEHTCENGHSFEEFQSIVEAPIDICPVCGARATRVISGGAGLIFKGTGFYVTDYVKKSGDGSTEKGSGEPSSKSGPSSKPDSKPAESKSTSETRTS